MKVATVASVAALAIRQRSSSVTSQRALARMCMNWPLSHAPFQYNEFAPLAKILPVHQTFVRRRPDIAFRLQSSLRYQGGNLNGQARCFNLHPSPWLIICRCRLSRLLWILSVDYPCGFRTPLLRPRSWGTWIFDCRPQTCNSNQMPARPGHAMWSEPRLARMRRTPQSIVLL